MNLKLGLFTTAALDKINVQIISSLSTKCLHGTSVFPNFSKVLLMFQNSTPLTNGVRTWNPAIPAMGLDQR